MEISKKIGMPREMGISRGMALNASTQEGDR
jgi:hypothetical protein